MTAMTPEPSPYPGLRPFQREESHLFFGREECIATMVDRLEKNRFLAVLGASGSGKSSLVKVGLIEALERGDMRAAGRLWRIVQFKPQGRPMYELACALLGEEASPQQIELMVAFLRRGPRSLLEWCESGQLKPHENLLIFVDQFEELFRYRTYAGREEAEAFVALMLRTKDTRRLPVYVTLTMRSEFLGACALIEDLAEAMNDGQFLTPQMTRDQCRAAIVGPARIGDFDVEEALVNRLLNDLATYSASDESLVRDANDGSTFGDVSSQSDSFARRADQLPLLQHALNGLYNWAARARSSDGPIVLRLKDYDEWGGLQGSLNRHADNILAEIEQKLGSERTQQVGARLFRALISGTSPTDAQRRPVRFRNLVQLCNGDEAAVRTIIEAFRKTGRNFLTPEPSKPLEDDSIVDISHESLIRQWTKLSDWLETEAQDARSWRWLADAAANNRKSTGDLLRGLDLQTLIDWRNHARPTAEWARRYGAKTDEFAGAIRFLQVSRYAQWARRIGLTVAVLGIGVLAAVGWWYIQETRNEAARNMVATQREAAEKSERAAERESRLAKDLQERSAKQADISNRLFRTSSQLFIKTAQRGENGWEQAGSFIASLIDATPEENLARRLKPLQGRMVAQYAFRPPQGEVGGTELRTDTRGNYRLSLLSNKHVAIIDARTRAVYAGLDLSDFDPVDQFATHSVSPDGNSVLIVATDAIADHGARVRLPMSSIIFMSREPESRYRPRQLADRIPTPDSLVVDWNNQRAIWQHVRDDIPEIATLDFGRARPEMKCKAIYDIDRYADNSLPPSPFDSYDTCLKSGDAKIQKERKLDGAFTVVSLMDTMAIIKIKITRPYRPPISKLIAIDTEKATAKNLVVSESGFLVSKNLASEAPLSAPQSVTAVVAHTARGRCAETSERPAGKSSDEAELQVCLSFVKNDGTMSDLPRVVLPSFEDESAYNPIRIRADDSNTSVVLDFSQRPGRWNIDVPQSGPRLAAVAQQPSRQAEPASSRILRWIHLGAANLPSVLNDQRWQYRAGKLRSLVISEDTAKVTTFQPGSDGPKAASSEPFKIPSELTGQRKGRLNELPWLLSDTSEKVVVGNGTKLYELDSESASSAKPPTDLKAATPSERCRAKGDFSIQTIKDWPGPNVAFLVLDSLGRAWWVPSQVDKLSNKVAREPSQPAAGSEAVSETRDQETGLSAQRSNYETRGTGAAQRPVCVAQNTAVSAVIALDPKSGRALVQLDKRMLHVMTAPEGDNAARLPSLEPINQTPLEDDIVAATFVQSDQIAVLQKGGALSIFSQTKDRWISKTIQDVGFVWDLDGTPSPSLSAGDGELLIFHRGKGIVLDLNEARDLPVTAAGSSPGSPEAMKVLGFKNGQIDLVAKDQFLQVQLPAVPPRDLMARVLVARYPPIRGDQVEMVRLQTIADSDGDAATLTHKRLAALADSNRCRKQLREYFAHEPFAERPDEEEQSRLRQQIREACNNRTSSEANVLTLRWGPDATSLSLGEGNVPWPRNASNILRAAESGDEQALWIIAGWTSHGMKGAPRYAGASSGAWGKLVHQAVGRERGDADSELDLGDPDLAQLSRSGPIDADRLQELSVRLKNRPNPRIHDRIGDRIRGGDSAAQRRALFHYSLAETLFAALGDDSNAKFAAEKRASTARILTPDEITEVQGLVTNWMASAWMASASLPALPADDLVRLREDLKLLDGLARSLKQEEMKLVFSVIANRIAATAQFTDGSLAGAARRSAAIFASSYNRPLVANTAQVVLDRWPGEFGDDRTLKISVLAKLLSAMENEKNNNYLSRISDLNSHRKLTELIIENVRPGDRSDLTTLASNLSLNRKPFWYQTVRGPDAGQILAAASALKSRDKMLTLLVEHDAGSANHFAHRGVGRFWMGISVANAVRLDSQNVGKTVRDLVGSRGKNIDDAITDLRKARELGDRNFDILHRLADSQRWLFSEKSNRDINSEGKDGISNYNELAKAVGDNQWPAPGGMASLLSEHANLLRNLSGRSADLDLALDEGWRTGDEKIRSRSAELILDSLFYASLAAQKAEEARGASGTNWATEPDKNRSFALALSRLANRLMSKTLPPADDCDRAVSHPDDPFRRAPNVPLSDLSDVSKFNAAKLACEIAYRERPQDPRVTYLLARTLYASKDKSEKQRGIVMFGEAAALNYAIAFHNIALLQKQEEEQTPYFNSFVQLVVKDHFPATFKYLSSQAHSDRHRDGLKWLAEQAANLGVAEAHEALAEIAPDQDKRKMHLLIAAKLSTGAAESRLATRANQIILSPGIEKRILREANEFEAEAVRTFGSTDKEKLKANLDSLS